MKEKTISFNPLSSCVLSVIFLFSFMVAQPDNNTQSISFYTGAGIPILGLNDWYGLTPVLGIQYAYKSDDKTDLVYEFHYQKFNHGSIENRKFLWVVDYNYYLSEETSANMSWNDFIFKIRKYVHNKSFALSGKTIIPTFSYGFGFYNYAHKVKGLIYPGQYIELDETFLMEPVIDRRVAWGGNLGLGGITSFNESMDIRFELNYHTAIGYVRAFEDWGLYEVVPIQFLTFELGFVYNY